MKQVSFSLFLVAFLAYISTGKRLVRNSSLPKNLVALPQPLPTTNTKQNDRFDPLKNLQSDAFKKQVHNLEKKVLKPGEGMSPELSDAAKQKDADFLLNIAKQYECQALLQKLESPPTFSFENETSKVRSHSDAEKMQLIEASLVLKDIYFPLHPAYLPFDVTKGGLYQNFSDI